MNVPRPFSQTAVYGKGSAMPDYYIGHKFFDLAQCEIYQVVHLLNLGPIVYVTVAYFRQ